MLYKDSALGRYKLSGLEYKTNKSPGESRLPVSVREVIGENKRLEGTYTTKGTAPAQFQ